MGLLDVKTEKMNYENINLFYFFCCTFDDSVFAKNMNLDQMKEKERAGYLEKTLKGQLNNMDPIIIEK